MADDCVWVVKSGSQKTALYLHEVRLVNGGIDSPWVVKRTGAFKFEDEKDAVSIASVVGGVVRKLRQK